MPSTRPSPTGWHPAGLVVILVAATALVAGHYLPIQGRTYVSGALLNLGHVAAFAATAWLAITWPPLRGQPWWTWALVLAAGGLLLESAQLLTTRDASATDWLRDVAGIGSGCLIALSRRGDWRRRVVLLALGAVLFLLAAAPSLRVIISFKLRDRAFPVLDDLSGEWEYRLRRIESTLAVTGEGDDRRLSVALSTMRYSGVAWSDPVPDWRDYDYLMFFVRPLDSEAIDLTLRIHDNLHNHTGEDRFRRHFHVPVGGLIVRFPLAAIQAAPVGRQMQLNAIRSVVLYAKALDRERVIEVSPLLLR